MYCTHKSSNTYWKHTIFILFLLMFAGCGGSDASDTAEVMVIDDTEALYFERVGQGIAGRFEHKVETIVSDSLEWVETVQKMPSLLPFKEVNFNQAMIAYVAFPFEHGGVSLEFETVEKNDKEIIFSYIVNLPARDCLIIDTPSVPFQAIMLPKIDHPTRFEYREEKLSCEL